MWDIINEVVIMFIFNKYDNGIIRICKEFGWICFVCEVFVVVIEVNLYGIFFINDFNIFVVYEILIEGLFEVGVRIDVIGI